MKILLVCNAGMSTSILVQKMDQAAKANGIDVEIEAMGFTMAEKKLLDWDVVLLGPQVRHQLAGIKKVANGKIPVAVIDMRDYGLMNGEGVLNAALNLIKDYQK